MNKIRKFIVTIFIGILITSCGNVSPVLTVAVTSVPSLLPPTSFITSSPILTNTPFPTNIPTSTPDFCNLAQFQGDIQIISGLRLTALEPGGPVDFDRILAEQNPAWADFRQYSHDEWRSAGVIFHETAFGPELGTGINPAVILVTYGVEQNWELPVNGNLVSEVDRIRGVLFKHRSDVVHGDVDLNQYSVGNGASYALYRYFNGDLSKLEDWCRTYVQVYGESPLD